MKTNDIIGANTLVELIAQYGAGDVSFDGAMPEGYASAADLGIEECDSFRVVINYGYEVQFHLISDDMRAVITTGLKGRCDDEHGWMA
jgi:hypothetical protein